LVSRNTCAANRRKVDICITASGLDLLKTLDPLVDLTEKNITSELNAEEQQLLNLLLQKIFN